MYIHIFCSSSYVKKAKIDFVIIKFRYYFVYLCNANLPKYQQE